MRSHRNLLRIANDPAGELDWWAQAFGRLVGLARSAGVTVAVDSNELAQVVADSIQVDSLLAAHRTAFACRRVDASTAR
jgi:hypothetical protein